MQIPQELCFVSCGRRFGRHPFPRCGCRVDCECTLSSFAVASCRYVLWAASRVGGDGECAPRAVGAAAETGPPAAAAEHQTRRSTWLEPALTSPPAPHATGARCNNSSAYTAAVSVPRLPAGGVPPHRVPLCTHQKHRSANVASQARVGANLTTVSRAFFETQGGAFHERPIDPGPCPTSASEASG